VAAAVGYANSVHAGMGHNGGPRLKLEADFPDLLSFFLEPRELLPSGKYAMRGRYKVAYGGRGGMKSWACARALVIRGLAGGLRALCTRLTQASTKGSVHQLIKDQISLLGLGPKEEGGSGHYKVLENEIRGPNGTLFIFKGLQDPDALKSAEGVDICWVEEARNVPEGTWKKLTPTVRKPGSEIWVTFNPELEIDATYKRFVLNAPDWAIVRKVTYLDNPWCPSDLRQEASELKISDPDEYMNVWLGFNRVALEGAVYARELRAAMTEGRVMKGPIFSPERPVYTIWDLGRSDLTAIWFVQIINFQYRIVGYYHNNGYVLGHYIQELQRRAMEKGYIYGKVWLPHDAEHKLLGQPRTIKQQLEDAGFTVKITPNIKKAEGINAARTIFPLCYFDEQECADGIDALRHYHYDVDDAGNRSKEPVHDWSSNGADAFRYFGVSLKEETPKGKPKMKAPAARRPGRNAWMGR
jgi:phage terminase large subunit